MSDLGKLSGPRRLWAGMGAKYLRIPRHQVKSINDKASRLLREQNLGSDNSRGIECRQQEYDGPLEQAHRAKLTLGTKRGSLWVERSLKVKRSRESSSEDMSGGFTFTFLFCLTIF